MTAPLTDAQARVLRFALAEPIRYIVQADRDEFFLKGRTSNFLVWRGFMDEVWMPRHEADHLGRPTVIQEFIRVINLAGRDALAAYEKENADAD